MAVFVAWFLWITSSNLVLAAPAVENPKYGEPETTSELQEEQANRLVTFSYTDSNFEQVFVSGNFTNWEQVPLVFDDGQWSITLQVPESKQYYNFMVDEGYDSWIAVDPDNSAIVNHEEYGWVSVLIKGYGTRESGKEKTKDVLKEITSERDRISTELRQGQLRMGEVTYQRVDGLVLGAELKSIENDGGLDPSGIAQGHFGFSSGRFGGSLAVLQPIIPNHLLDLKLNLFHKTEANNFLTGIGSDENAIAGMFLHEDYRDYHLSKGVKLSLVFKLGNWLRLQGGVRTEEQTSLGAPSVWSFKSGDFIENPVIDDGSLNSLFSNITIGGKYNYITASYQRSHEDLVGGDFDFEKVDAKIRGRLKLGKSAGFDIRLAGGTNLKGHLPAQERYLLGGLGTVRGYSYQSLMVSESPQSTNSYGGQRMAMGNLEYFFRLGKCLKLNLFYDAGMVWENKDAAVSVNKLKTSTGLGVNLGKGDGLRVNMIQRLDDRTRPVVFQFRLKRMF